MKRKNELTQAIEDNKPLELKKLLPRLIAFLVALALAVTFITIGLSRMGRLEEGLQTIEALEDEAVPRYQLGVSFQHWFSGSSKEIRLAVAELRDLYAGALKDAFRMLDPENLYEGWANLATLNQNLGREVKVSRELYEVLREADRLTRQGRVYNLYGGVLYSEWEGLLYQLEPEPFDPCNDPEEAARLERLTAATRELSNFSLEFLNDETCTLRFTVDLAYLDLLEELELADVPILDLNVLRDAFKLQLVAARLEARGYDRGFLSDDSGLTLTLSGYADGGDYCFYGEKEGEAVPAAACPVTAGSCCVQLRAFGLREEPGYYALEQGGQTLLRHPWLPADGVYREVLLGAFLVSGDLSLPEACYACLALYACDTAEEAEALVRSVSGKAALLLREDPLTVRSTDDALRPAEDSGFSWKRLP